MELYVQGTISLKISTVITSSELLSGRSIERKLSDVTKCELYDRAKDLIVSKIEAFDFTANSGDVPISGKLCINGKPYGPFSIVLKSSDGAHFIIDKELFLNSEDVHIYALPLCSTDFRMFSDMYQNGRFIFNSIDGANTDENVGDSEIEFCMEIGLVSQ